MIKFNSHNGIEIYVDIPSNDPNDSAPDSGTFRLSWNRNPKQFAQDLRRAAAFIEYHADANITIDVD